VLVFADHEWFASSYVWDAEQSDAELVESQRQIDLQIEGKESMVPWRVLKPTGCFECHRNGAITRNPSKLDLAAIPCAKFGATSWDLASNHSINGTAARPQKIEWSPLLAAGLAGSSDPTGGQGVDWDWFKKSLVEENLEPWYRATVRPSVFFVQSSTRHGYPSQMLRLKGEGKSLEGYLP